MVRYVFKNVVSHIYFRPIDIIKSFAVAKKLLSNKTSSVEIID